MQEIKIAHLTVVHPAFDTRIFYKEARSLAGAGYNVVLIAPHGRDEVIDGVMIKSLPIITNRLARLFSFWRPIRLAIKERAAVYHLHDPELLLAGVVLKAVTGAKIVFDVHEDMRQQILQKHWVPRSLRRFFSLTYGAFEKVCLPIFDKIIIVIDEHFNIYQNRKKVVCVRNYPASLSHRAPIPRISDPEPINLLYHGVISKHRGAFQLISAFELVYRECKRARLSLIGTIESVGMEEELRSLIEAKRLGGVVTLRPRLDFATLSDLLPTFHIGLCVLMPIPNYVNSLPTKLFEYMAAGLPVVVSDFPIFRTIVKGADCGLTVDPLSPESIARAILRLISDPQAAYDMGRRGRSATLEKYNWKHEEKVLFEVYDELIGKSYASFSATRAGE